MSKSIGSSPLPALIDEAANSIATLLDSLSGIKLITDRALCVDPNQANAAKAKAKENKPDAAGKRWEPAEDEELIRLWNDRKDTCKTLSVHFQRTEGAIASRLVKLNVLPNTDAVREEEKSRKQ